MGLFFIGEIQVKEEKLCQYEKCRMEAERGSDYCKYHVRMVRSYQNMSPELKEAYDRIKKERYG